MVRDGNRRLGSRSLPPVPPAPGSPWQLAGEGWGQGQGQVMGSHKGPVPACPVESPGSGLGALPC